MSLGGGVEDVATFMTANFHPDPELAFGRFGSVLAPGPIPTPKWIGPRPK